MTMKKTDIISIILNGLCALLLSGKVIYDFFNKTYPISSRTFILEALCAAAWIALFVMRLVYSKKNRKEE